MEKEENSNNEMTKRPAPIKVSTTLDLCIHVEIEFDFFLSTLQKVKYAVCS